MPKTADELDGRGTFGSPPSSGGGFGGAAGGIIIASYGWKRVKETLKLTVCPSGVESGVGVGYLINTQTCGDMIKIALSPTQLFFVCCRLLISMSNRRRRLKATNP